MKGRRKVDLFRLYYRILFSINSAVSWSEEGIDSLGTRTARWYRHQSNGVQVP